MAHLKNFGVGNFRAIKDLYNFELAPITILTGTNSSGKSSLTKAMLLFKESYSSTDGLPILDDLKFDPKLQIGNFDTVVNHGSKSNEIIIEVPCRFFIEDLSTIRLTYKPSNKLIKNGELSKLEIYNNTDKSIFLTYCPEGSEAGIKIDFGSLYQMMLSDDKLVNDYRDIVRKLNEKLWDLGLGSFDNIKFNDLQSYPNEIIELCNAKTKLDYVNFSSITGSNTLSAEIIYYTDANQICSALPIFDYHAIINEVFPDLSRELYKLFDDSKYNSYEEYDFVCKQQLEELKKAAAQENKSLLDFLVGNEISVLNSLLFKDISCFYVGQDFTFMGCLQSVNSFLSDNPINERRISDPFTLGVDGSMFHQKKFDSYEPLLESHALMSETDPIVAICDPRFKEYIVNRKYVFKALSRLKDEKKYNNGLWNSRSFFDYCIQSKFRSFFDQMDSIFKSLEYLPSVRSDISRRYRNGDERTEFQKLLNSFFSRHSSGAKSLPFIDKYVKKFDLADKVEFIPSSDNFDSRVIIYKGDKEFDLADVGYGYSQLLPIILKLGLQIEANSSFEGHFGSSVLIIEEPETNLHPKLQSQLADLFIDCYKNYHIQLIIETHSEYLIRKLQYYTAKRTISPSDTQLYYFNHPEEVAKGKQLVKKINIQHDGSLSDDFGSGFFDEANKIAIDLFNMTKNSRN